MAEKIVQKFSPEQFSMLVIFIVAICKSPLTTFRLEIEVSLLSLVVRFVSYVS